MDESSDTYNAIMSIAGDYSLTKGWTPPSDTYILIYHSKNDDTVPYDNLGAMATFIKNHTKKNVFDGENGGHMDAVIPFVQKVLANWNE
jgi:predicted esterase